MVRDRIVKLALGDVGLEFLEDGGKGKCEGREVREGERSTDMREWVLGFGSKVDMGKQD